jgi:hypothetical protein
LENLSNPQIFVLQENLETLVHPAYASPDGIKGDVREQKKSEGINPHSL